MNEKEMSADFVPPGFAEEVKRRIDEISLYYVENGRVMDGKIGEMFEDAETYIKQFPDIRDREKKSALAELYTSWGQSPEKIAEGYTLAEESGNGTVLASKMVDELFKINDKGEQLRRIDEEMIPKMEVLKCEEGKGKLLFWRTMAMLQLSHPLPEIGRTFARAAALLPQDNVMHAAAVCGERTVKFLAENTEAPYEGVRVISLQCRMEKGKLLYLFEPGFDLGGVIMKYSQFSSVDYYAACRGKLFFDLSMKPGEIRTWGEKESFLLVSTEESVTVPVGRFTGCMHTSYRDAEEGFSAEVWYAKDVGLVRAVFADDSNSETYELAEFERKGGDGYFPMAEGNRWRYRNPALPEAIAWFYEILVTWTDGVTANLFRRRLRNTEKRLHACEKQ